MSVEIVTPEQAAKLAMTMGDSVTTADRIKHIEELNEKLLLLMEQYFKAKIVEEKITLEQEIEQQRAIAQSSMRGMRTTEFWFNAGAMLFTVIQSSDLFPHGSVEFKVTSVIMAWLGALGYAGCRTLVKRKGSKL